MALEKDIPGERIIWIDADDTTRERDGCDSNRTSIIADILSGEISGGILKSIEDDVPPTDVTEDLARLALGEFSAQATDLDDWHQVPALIREHCGDEVESEKAGWLAEATAEDQHKRDLNTSYYNSRGVGRRAAE